MKKLEEKFEQEVNWIVSDSPIEVKGFGYTAIGKIKAPRLRWLVSEIIPKEVLAFISGQAKVGKSTLALYMALCLSSGQSFFGYRTKRSKVLYIALEDNAGEFKAKAKHFMKEKRLPKGLYLLNSPSLSLPGDFDRLKVDIESSKASLVILDTLRRSHVGEENSSSEMAALLNPLRVIVKEMGVTILVIHHAGRDIEHKENPGDYLRGSSDLNASWEVLIGLCKEQSGVKARVFHKYRSPLEFSYAIQRADTEDTVTQDRPIIGLVLADGAQHKLLAEEESVHQVLLNNPQSATSLQKHFKGQISRPRIDDALERLAVKKRARSEGKGKNCK